ncbi:hypothetical protein F441_22144 [Phytophthora nicotianae CJ01A1]|uniref:Zinc/iron permease n=1 Tax=Phytophthora nicotianae CJ01A1 TaxID=1317063 RepID=W2VSV0_PHYNI|nr:hypothetical protein F441_22144 [Phytophthora nicotianae CJ01A1]
MKRRSLQLPERNATPQNQVISFPQCPGQCQNLTYALHEVLRQLAKSSIAHQRSIAVLTLYSCMTPLGIFLGMVLSDSLRGSSALTMEAVALSIASGSFIYLAFHELSEENASQETNSAEKLALFSMGISSMAVLAAWA